MTFNTILATYLDNLKSVHGGRELGFPPVYNASIGDARFGSKFGHIGPKWDKSRTFLRSVLLWLGGPDRMYRNLIWKSHGFVSIMANQTHLEAKRTPPPTKQPFLDHILHRHFRFGVERRSRE